MRVLIPSMTPRVTKVIKEENNFEFGAGVLAKGIKEENFFEFDVGAFAKAGLTESDGRAYGRTTSGSNKSAEQIEKVSEERARKPRHVSQRRDIMSEDSTHTHTHTPLLFLARSFFGRFSHSKPINQ